MARRRLVDELRELGTRRNGHAAAPPGDPEPAPAWEVPIPLTAAVETPPFPLDVLPRDLARFLEAVAMAKSCPVDYAAIPLLTIAGAAIGTSRALEIKPGWRERACLFAAVIGPPGSAKTPALKAAAVPVYAEQSRRLACYRRQLVGWQENDEQGPRPQLESLFVCDITVEKLACIVRDNPRGVALIRDELTGWVDSMGQYKAGRGADRQAFLSMWAGEPVRIDRKSEGEPIYITNPFVAVIGGLPPAKLPTLRGERGVWDGFLDRVLLSFPEPLPAKGEDWLCVESEMTECWGSALAALWAMRPELTADQEIRPRYVRLTTEGRRAWEVFTAGIAKQVNRDDLSDQVKGHIAKFRGYGARLALIVHCLRQVCGDVTDEDVDGISIDRSARLVDYFRGHCLKVHAALGADPDVDDAQRVLDWIDRERPAEFKRYQVFEDVKGQRFARIEDLDKPLGRLEKHRVIRRREVAQQGRGRPADPIFEVNPALLRNRPKNPKNPKNSS